MGKKPKKNRQLKREKIQELKRKVAEAKSVVFADYRGLTANQIGQLRNKIKDAGGEIIIAKNTLLALALQSTDYRLLTTDSLTGPTATVFSYQDELAPIREIAQGQKSAGLPKFKFGFLGKDLLDAEALANLAKIPSRDTLIVNLVGSVYAPLYGVVSVLGANIRNLLYVLDQKAKQSSA